MLLKCYKVNDKNINSICLIQIILKLSKKKFTDAVSWEAVDSAESAVTGACEGTDVVEACGITVARIWIFALVDV